MRFKTVIRAFVARLTRRTVHHVRREYFIRTNGDNGSFKGKVALVTVDRVKSEGRFV